MVFYFHLLKNFPQFVVIHTVKGFGTVNKAEIDVFLELSCFFNDQKAMATHSSTVAWKVPWAEEPDGLQSMGSQRVGHNYTTSVSLSVDVGDLISGSGLF